MSNAQPKTPLAVRLARFARPSEKWEESSGLPHLAWTAALGEWFSAKSLDHLALAERRVVEAGLWEALGEAISGVLFDQHFSATEAQQMILLYTATAAQRAAALDALFTAHPDLCQRLTSSPEQNDE